MSPPTGGLFSENDAKRVASETLIEFGQSSVYEITLNREVELEDYIDDGAGGVIADPEASSPVLTAVRRFFQPVTGDPLFALDAQGREVRITHVLIGEIGDDILPEDTFTVNDRDFYVVYVDADKRFQTKALCRSRENP